MQNAETDGTFWSPRECLRNPIPEVFEAAMLLKLVRNKIFKP